MNRTFEVIEVYTGSRQIKAYKDGDCILNIIINDHNVDGACKVLEALGYSLLQMLWSKEANNPEKYIEIVDMDSNVVHDLDVVRRINKKLERITSGIGC